MRTAPVTRSMSLISKTRAMCTMRWKVAAANMRKISVTTPAAAPILIHDMSTAAITRQASERPPTEKMCCRWAIRMETAISRLPCGPWRARRCPKTHANEATTRQYSARAMAMEPKMKYMPARAQCVPSGTSSSTRLSKEKPAITEACVARLVYRSTLKSSCGARTTGHTSGIGAVREGGEAKAQRRGPPSAAARARNASRQQGAPACQPAASVRRGTAALGALHSPSRLW